jgi:hypothetical protein
MSWWNRSLYVFVIHFRRLEGKKPKFQCEKCILRDMYVSSQFFVSLDKLIDQFRTAVWSMTTWKMLRLCFKGIPSSSFGTVQSCMESVISQLFDLRTSKNADFYFCFKYWKTLPSLYTALTIVFINTSLIRRGSK